MRVFVKICGLTRPEYAEAAVEAGADAIGLVFYPKSPRFVGDLGRAREVAEVALPFVVVVGVFVNPTREEVLRAAGEVPLQAVQLHGEEPPEFARNLGLPVIKAFRPRGPADLEAALDYPCCAVLVDTYRPGKWGGTGQPFPWEWARDLARRRKVILAGGLGPENVGRALSVVGPYGVDVSSGVEREPGVKDHAKIRAFLEVVREWERRRGS